MDVLLLFVGLFVDPFDFAGQGGYGIGGDHFVVVGAFALCFESVILAKQVFEFPLQLLQLLLELSDLSNSHVLLLLDFLVAPRQSIMRLGNISEVAAGLIEIPLEFALFLHHLGLLIIQHVVVVHLSLQPLDILADGLFVSLDDDALFSDVFLELLLRNIVLIQLFFVAGNGLFENLLFLGLEVVFVFLSRDLGLVASTLVCQLHF